MLITVRAIGDPCPAIVYGRGEWRPVDNGKRAGANLLTIFSETVACMPPEFAAFTVKALAAALFGMTGRLPEWPKPTLSVEDWWKGCRQVAPHRRSTPVLASCLFPTHLHAGIGILPPVALRPITRPALWLWLRC